MFRIQQSIVAMVLLSLSLGILAAPSPKNVKQTLKERLVGSWEIYAAEDRERTIPRELIEEEQDVFRFSVDSFTHFRRGKERRSCGYLVEEGSPNNIALVLDASTKEYHHAIFSIEGNEMKWCSGRPFGRNEPKDRPLEIGITEKNKHVDWLHVFHMRRTKE